jgi:hypothetical protein
MIAKNDQWQEWSAQMPLSPFLNRLATLRTFVTLRADGQNQQSRAARRPQEQDRHSSRRLAKLPGARVHLKSAPFVSTTDQTAKGSVAATWDFVESKAEGV